MTFSKKRPFLHKRPREIACVPRKQLEDLLNMRIWVSDTPPIYKDNGHTALMKSARLLHINGRHALFRDLLTQDTEIQSILSEFKGGHHKAIDCFSDDQLRPNAVVASGRPEF